jgi:quinol monooxygenase YgiN
MIDGLGFCVLYRARLHPGKEELYIAAWSKLTRLLRSERGGLGSRLHRGADGLWYAYAQWASAEARDAAFKLPSVDPAAEQDVRDSILEYFPEIVLEPIEDQLIPIKELAPNNSFKPNPLRSFKTPSGFSGGSA